MTHYPRNKQHQPPSSLVLDTFFANAVCIAMPFSSASYFSFRFSNGSL